MFHDHHTTIASSPATALSHARVLIIDDEPAILRLLQRALERFGISSHAVSSACAALEQLRSHQYDVLICDLRMPDVSGQQLYAQIRAAAPQVAERMIFSSGDVTSDEAVEFLTETGLPCVPKPFDLAYVIALVSARLDGGSRLSAAA